MKLKSISQEDIVTVECIWCSYTKSKKNPCMSCGSHCSHLCLISQKAKNPFDISINIKAIISKKKKLPWSKRSKKEQFWWMIYRIEWVHLWSSEMMSGILLPLSHFCCWMNSHEYCFHGGWWWWQTYCSLLRVRSETEGDQLDKKGNPNLADLRTCLRLACGGMVMSSLLMKGRIAAGSMEVTLGTLTEDGWYLRTPLDLGCFMFLT